jgi:hypothetical protein
MARRLKRSLIVLGPTLSASLITWLAPTLVLRGRTPAALDLLLSSGSLVLLVVGTAWISARCAGLGRWAAATAGALVVLLGRVLPRLVLGTVMTLRSHSRWDAVAWLAVVGVFLTLGGLPLGCLGAWIATRAQPKPM